MNSGPGTGNDLLDREQAVSTRQVSGYQARDEIEQLCSLLARAAAQGLGADAAAVWLFDEAGGRLTLSGVSGLPLTPALSPPRPDGPTAVVIVEDGSRSEQGIPLPGGFRAALCVPVGPEPVPPGTLCVYDAHPRAFTPSEVQFLQLLAGVGAVALAAMCRCKELEQAESERARLASVTVHELRSPITIAQSLLKNVLKGYAGPVSAAQQDVLERIAGQLDALGCLVNDYLDLAAAKAPGGVGEEGPVVINVVVARAVLVLQPRAEEKGLSLTLRPCREELAVWASEEGLEHVFHNLVENAVKYTNAGGSVTVSLGRSDHEAVVRVADTGIGIPAEAQAHLFEEFYRAPNARAQSVVGTGLGLAIVKRFVERYHGRIAVESALGQGTTFTVTFPLYVSAR